LAALLLAVGSALGRSKVWPIALVAASGIKLFFLSPTWMAAIYQDATFMLTTLAFLAAPIVAMIIRGRGDGAEQALFSLVAPQTQAGPAPVQRPQSGDDILDWDRITNKDDPDHLQEYLLRHPSGRFAELARMKLERMNITPLQPPTALPATPPAAATTEPAPPPISSAPVSPRDPQRDSDYERLRGIDAGSSLTFADEEPRRGNLPIALFVAIGVVLLGVVGAGGFYWWTGAQEARAAEAAWNAVPKNDAHALRQYLTNAADEYRHDAETALSLLEAERYLAAREADTIDAMQAFIDDFPDSERVMAARGRIAELQMQQIAAAEAAAAAAAARATWRGTWRGTMQQNGRNYDLIVNFQANAESRLLAAVEYVELRCSGRWEGGPGDNAVTTQRVREIIERGRTRCVGEGIIELTPQPDGAISVTFYYPDGRPGGMTGLIYQMAPPTFTP